MYEGKRDIRDYLNDMSDMLINLQEFVDGMTFRNSVKIQRQSLL